MITSRDLLWSGLDNNDALLGNVLGRIQLSRNRTLHVAVLSVRCADLLASWSHVATCTASARCLL